MKLKAERSYFRKSQAKTAWGLMQAVNRAILAEPRRLYMGNWISSFLDRRQAKEEVGFTPACGTVGCYAGWVAMLAEGQETFGVQTTAVELLAGVGTNQNGILRDELVDAFLNTHAADKNGRYLLAGTKPYARAIVQRFEVIMEEHKTFLKAQAV